MAAVIVPNTAPSFIEVASAELLERHDALTHQSATMPITTEAQKVEAEGVAKALRALAKEITEHRKRGTAILDSITATAIAEERTYVGTVDSCWAALATRINGYITAENVKRAEAARLAREDQERLQKIEDDRAEAARQALQEQAELDAPPGAPPVEIPVTKALPVYIPERYVPPPMTSAATKKKTTFSLEWIDATKAPITSPKGHRLLLPDDSAFIAYLKTLPAGQREIAGCVRLVETSGIAAKG